MVILLDPGQSGLPSDLLVDPSRNPSSCTNIGGRGSWNGHCGNLGGNCPDQSGFAPENLITLAHFSVSSAMRFPYSLGDSANTSPPSSAKRALIVASARAALISLLSVSMNSAGVFFGAPIPAHALVSKPGTKSPSVGTSGSPCQRVVAVTAKGRSLPALICSMEEGMLSNMTCTCPAMRSVSAGGAPR